MEFWSVAEGCSLRYGQDHFVYGGTGQHCCADCRPCPAVCGYIHQCPGLSSNLLRQSKATVRRPRKRHPPVRNWTPRPRRCRMLSPFSKWRRKTGPGHKSGLCPGKESERRALIATEAELCSFPRPFGNALAMRAFFGLFRDVVESRTGGLYFYSLTCFAFRAYNFFGRVAYGRSAELEGARSARCYRKKSRTWG